MNVNKLLIDTLGEATSLPVAPDQYDGKSTEYIIFTYTDERSNFWGDNLPISDIVYLQIQLITPKSFNYMTLKHTIKSTLESNGFIISSIRSFLGSALIGTENTRQTIFECSLTEQRGA